MATSKGNTSVRRSSHSRPTDSSTRTSPVPADLPKNIREVVLRGIDLGESSDSGKHRFTGHSLSIKKGTFLTNAGGFDGTEPAFEIPYVATFRFGKPRQR